MIKCYYVITDIPLGYDRTLILTEYRNNEKCCIKNLLVSRLTGKLAI